MVNVDAGFDENDGCDIVDSITKDCSVGVLAAGHSFIPNLVGAPMAKAYTMKYALMLV